MPTILTISTLKANQRGRGGSQTHTRGPPVSPQRPGHAETVTPGAEGRDPTGQSQRPRLGPATRPAGTVPQPVPQPVPRKCEGRCPGRVCPGRRPREHRKPRTRGASLLLRMNRLWKGAAGCAGEGEGQARKLPGLPGPAVIAQRGLCLAPKAGWAWAGEGAARPTWPRTEPPASLPFWGALVRHRVFPQPQSPQNAAGPPEWDVSGAPGEGQHGFSDAPRTRNALTPGH